MKEDVSSVLDSEIDYEFQGKDFGYARTEKNEVRQMKQRYMTNDIHTTQHNGQQGEIILYQPDETIRLEVRLEDDTVWLNQAQMGELFGTNRQAITKHLQNIYDCEELRKESTSSILELVRREGNRNVRRKIEFYNLDAIISVGFRVNTKRGIEFRQWANRVLKEYLLKGHVVNSRIIALEQRVEEQGTQLKQVQQKIDFFVRTSLPPVEGVLFEGQIFDAYKLVETLIKSAKREIFLIDNYVDAAVFDLLEKREQGVDATIYTEHVGQSLIHLQQLNQQQYGRKVEVKEYNNRFHDRFHPSSERLAQCGDHRLLLVTPWRYHYRYADTTISVLACKTMNCLAQALCRQKDTWWQT